MLHMTPARLAVAALVLAAAPAQGADAKLAPRGAKVAALCQAGESILFSCSAGKKVLSVCASRTLGATEGYIQYRFGLVGATPEMQVPETRRHPSGTLRADTLSFSGGGGAYLRFARGDFSYVVYTGVGKGWGEKAGVSVEKDRQPLANVKCSGPYLSELGPDLFQAAAIPADGGGFTLP